MVYSAENSTILPIYPRLSPAIRHFAVLNPPTLYWCTGEGLPLAHALRFPISVQHSFHAHGGSSYTHAQGGCCCCCCLAARFLLY